MTHAACVGFQRGLSRAHFNLQEFLLWIKTVLFAACRRVNQTTDNSWTLGSRNSTDTNNFGEDCTCFDNTKYVQDTMNRFFDIFIIRSWRLLLRVWLEDQILVHCSFCVRLLGNHWSVRGARQMHHCDYWPPRHYSHCSHTLSTRPRIVCNFFWSQPQHICGECQVVRVARNLSGCIGV